MRTLMQPVLDTSSLDDLIVADFFSNGTDFIPSSPIFVGWDISSELLDYADRKMLLLTIIDDMVKDAPSWDGDPVRISEKSASSAKRFLMALPPNRELPKVAPDGEGDLLFVWEPPHGNCIVTVQEDILHMVDQPGRAAAEHIDAQPFAGRRIPISILHALPLR